jgi:hypothetical protein
MTYLPAARLTPTRQLPLVLTSVKSIITTDQQKNTDKVPVVDMVEFHNHEQLSRLESTLTKSIGFFHPIL